MMAASGSTRTQASGWAIGGCRSSTWPARSSSTFSSGWDRDGSSGNGSAAPTAAKRPRLVRSLLLEDVYLSLIAEDRGDEPVVAEVDVE